MLNNFEDLKVDGNEILLEKINDSLNVTATEDEVQNRITNAEIQEGKWAEYIQKWKDEGRV